MKRDMTAGMDSLPERVDTIERKLDSLSASVDARFEQIDQRFDRVDARFEQVDRRFDRMEAAADKRTRDVTDAFVDHRLYVEHAFDTLRGEMTEAFARADRRLTVEIGRLERKIDLLIDLHRPRRRPAPGPKRKR